MSRQTIKDRAEHWAHDHPAKTIFLGFIMPTVAWLIFYHPFGG